MAGEAGGCDQITEALSRADVIPWAAESQSAGVGADTRFGVVGLAWGAG